MQISNNAYIDFAKYGFEVGVRTAVVEFLEALEHRGVEFNHDYNLNDLANEVRYSDGYDLLDEEGIW